jgi:LysR family glycine cleavage system transcriptional activator
MKAFEAVARLMSFTLAANELHVTQSAVSRQVKQLEDDLGASLIIRQHRTFTLTDKGQALYAVLQKNYQSVEGLVASWRGPKADKIVIKASLSYVSRSLMPKIQQLHERYPNHEIVVIPAIEDEPDIHAGEHDLYIFSARESSRYDREKDTYLLRREYMAPVCAASLLHDPTDTEAIYSLPRLHPTLDHSDWKAWLALCGRSDTGSVRNTTYYTLDLALSACLTGHGVTVTDLLLVLPEVEQGFLVCPQQIEIEHGDWLYYYHRNSHSPVVDELVQWLTDETEQEIARLKRFAGQIGWDLPS